MGCDDRGFTEADKWNAERKMAKQLSEKAWRDIGLGKPPKEAIESALLDMAVIITKGLY